MSIDIRSILPDELSDETAYVLIGLFAELAAAFDSIYFAQARRHLVDGVPEALWPFSFDDDGGEDK